MVVGRTVAEDAGTGCWKEWGVFGKGMQGRPAEMGYDK